MGGPEYVLVFPLDRAMEVHSPNDAFVAKESKGFKGNGNFRRPSLIMDLCRHLPLFIPILIGDLSFVGNSGVVLGPQWIDPKQIAIPAVVKGIQDQLKDVIVFEKVIPAKLR